MAARCDLRQDPYEYFINKFTGSLSERRRGLDVPGRCVGGGGGSRLATLTY
jgi:hypothetical protein